MNFDEIFALAEEWRVTAAGLRRRELCMLAAQAEEFADDLERRLRDWLMRLLFVDAASKECGYSEKHLRELVRTGVIEDLRPPGSKGRMRIRRIDLPVKPGHTPVRFPISVEPQPATDDPVEDLASRLLDSRRSPGGVA